MAFENANPEWKKVIRPLKARLIPIGKWIKDMADIESYTDGANLIEEVISKSIPKNKICKINCGKVFVHKACLEMILF